MDPDAAETLWLAKWGERAPEVIDIIAAQPPWNQRLMQQDCFETYKLGNVDWRRLKEENGNS